MFYTASTKELLHIRNKIFLEKGIPVLEKNGFKKSPFSNADFGWHASLGYFYELCRLSSSFNIEIINVKIVRGDKWIQISLNIFELNPKPSALDQLVGFDGMQFNLPLNRFSNMRFHSDEITGIPLFNYSFMANKHKLKRYFTKNGLERRAMELGDRIEKDLKNIDYFVANWHKLHKPKVTDWEGKIENVI